MKGAIEATITALDKGELAVSSSGPVTTGPRVDKAGRAALLEWHRWRPLRSASSITTKSHQTWVRWRWRSLSLRPQFEGVPHRGRRHPHALLCEHWGLGAVSPMVDTWATVGSCADCRNVHLSGGVGIRGNFTPSVPVVVEDGALSESMHRRRGCSCRKRGRFGRWRRLDIIDANIDVTGAEPVIHKGAVPPVVIPGSVPKASRQAHVQVPAALIIGERKASTDRRPASTTRFDFNVMFDATEIAI